jgi:hypothetical protein
LCEDADENGENREAGQQTMLHHLHCYHHHLQSTPALIQAYFSASPLINFLFSLDIQSLSFRTVMQNHSKFLQNGFLLSLKKFAQIL